MESRAVLSASILKFESLVSHSPFSLLISHLVVVVGETNTRDSITTQHVIFTLELF